MNTNDVLNKLIAEIERLKGLLIRGACAAQVAMETNCKDEAYNEVLSFITSLQQEQTNEGVEEQDDDQCPVCGWALDAAGCCSCCGYGRR